MKILMANREGVTVRFTDTEFKKLTGYEFNHYTPYSEIERKQFGTRDICDYCFNLDNLFEVIQQARVFTELKESLLKSNDHVKKTIEKMFWAVEPLKKENAIIEKEKKNVG